MSMREKIARALLAYDLPMKVGWNSIRDEMRLEYLDRADAALDALMEPTKEMIEALNGKAQCIGLIEEGWEAAMQAAKDGK